MAAQSNFPDLKLFLTKYKFKLNDDPLPDDVVCTICGGLMVQPQLSLECGCRYCLQCFIDYSENSDKYCPGNGPECKLCYLSKLTQTVDDKSVSRKIAHIKVHCINKDCNVVDEIMNMPDHFASCQYNNINNNKTVEPALNDAEEDDEMNLKVLQETVSNFKSELMNLSNMVNQYRQMMAEMKENTNQQLNELKLELANCKREQKASLQNLPQIAAIKSSLKSDIMEVKNDLKNFKAVQMYSSDAGYICRIIDLLNHQREMSKPGALSGDWYSASFYSYRHGYKMYLTFEILNDIFRITVTIQPGELDAILTWPFSDEIKITLIDQDSRKKHVVQKRNCVIAKHGKARFDFTYSSLHSGIKKNDQMYVSCEVIKR